MTKALGTVRANDALRIAQCFDGSLKLPLTKIKICEDFAISNASAALSSDVKQNLRGVAWPTGRIYGLQKPRKIKAHVGVVCDTPAHWFGSLLTRAKRVEINAARVASRPGARRERAISMTRPRRDDMVVLSMGINTLLATVRQTEARWRLLGDAVSLWRTRLLIHAILATRCKFFTNTDDVEAGHDITEALSVADDECPSNVDIADGVRAVSELLDWVRGCSRIGVRSECHRWKSSDGQLKNEPEPYS